MNITKLLVAASLVVFATACTKIETGQVGVVTTVSGQIKNDEVGQGLHSSFFDDIEKFTSKQIPVKLEDLKPKASDNLRLQDFDVVVYYSVSPSAVSELAIKYNNATKREDGVSYPAYNLVEQVARSAANEAVAKHPSMQLNDKRVELEGAIREALEKEFNRTDKGAFIFERVNVTNILTDASVEKSIQAVASSENRKRTALNELEVAKVEAETNKVKSQALDNKVLAQQQIEVMRELAKSNNKVFVVSSDIKANMLINQ